MAASGRSVTEVSAESTQLRRRGVWRSVLHRDARSTRLRRGWLVRRVLLAADVAGLALAFATTELFFRGEPVHGMPVAVQVVVFIALLPLWVVAAKLYGLYDRDEERATYSTADEVVSVFHLTTVAVWLFFATSWFVGLAHPNQAKLTVFWLLTLVCVIAMRSIARSLARRHPAYIQRAIVVGAGDVGQLIARKVLQHPEYGIKLVGFADADPRELRGDLGGIEVIGTPDEIVDLVEHTEADRVIFAFSEDRQEDVLELVRALRKQDDVQIDIVPRLFEAVSPTADVYTIEGLPLVGAAPARIPRSSRLLKRLLDIVGAIALLALTAPLLLVLALLVRRDSPGPALFRQPRLGYGMHEFTLLKFRTMREETDDGPHREYLKEIMTPTAAPEASSLYKLDRSDAVTGVGRWLRRTSLDELPQLLNVLWGDMSLVGPRPAIPYELELYAPHHFERFLVPAGLTGLWQVEARAHSTFREALDLDVTYARSWSLGLDLRLLLRTPKLMFRKRETG